MDRQTVEICLRSLAQSTKGGVLLKNLDSEFQELIGSPIPYQQLGFADLESMLYSLPDVLKIVTIRGEDFVTGVANESTAHIVHLVSKQRDAKPRRQNNKQIKWPTKRRNHAAQNSSRSETSRNRPRRSYPYKNDYQRDECRHEDDFNEDLPAPYEASYHTSVFNRLGTRRPSPKYSRYSPSPRYSRYSPSPRYSRYSPNMPRGSRRRERSSYWEDSHRTPNVHHQYELFKSDEDVLYEEEHPCKAFVQTFAYMNNLNLYYDTSRHRDGRRGYMSVLILDDEQYNTFPNLFRTRDEAEEFVAFRARMAIEGGIHKMPDRVVMMRDNCIVVKIRNDHNNDES